MMHRERYNDTKPPAAVPRRGDSPCTTDEDRVSAASLPCMHLHPLLYALSWLGVLSVHGLAAHYHLKTSRLYSSLESTSLADRLVAFDVVDGGVGGHFDALRGLHIVLCVLHVIGAVVVLKNSLEDQALSFYSEDFTRWALDRFKQTETTMVSTRTIELALHTIFAYQLSKRVVFDQLWSSLYISMLVFSYLSVSLAVSLSFRQHRLSTISHHVMTVFFLVLHLLGLVVIPLVPLLQYASYNMLGDRMQWLKDVWVVTFCDNMHTVLYVSWADAVARVSLSLKLVYDLLIFKCVVRRRVGSAIAIQPLFRSAVRSFAEIRGGMQTTAPDKLKSEENSSITPPFARVFNWRNLYKPATVILAAWGVSVAVIHTTSQLLSTGNDPVCLSPTVPWLKTQTECRLVDINCAKLQIDGQQTELDALWREGFDPSSLQVLVLRHCPRLEIPSSFRTFGDLKILRIYNSTIASWPIEASIDSTSMNRLHTLSLVRVTFPSGNLPPGLLSPQIPSSLRFISIVETNLARLPANLDSLWKPLGPEASLAIESSDLTEIPAVLMRLNVGSISLTSNAIRDIPPELFQLDQLKVISLGFTSISALPLNVTKLGDSLSVLSIIGTAVADIPQWFDAFLSADRIPPPNLNNKFRLKAGSTKWCNSLVANLRDRRVAAYAARTDCGSMDVLGFPVGFVAIHYDASAELGIDPPPPTG